MFKKLFGKFRKESQEQEVAPPAPASIPGDTHQGYAPAKFGQKLYLDKGSLQQTVNPGTREAPNPNIYWNSSNNTMTLQNTGIPGRHGTPAPYGADLQNTIAEAQAAREELQREYGYAQAYIGERLAETPRPGGAALASLAKVDMHGQTGAELGEQDLINIAARSSYNDMLSEVEEIVTSGEWGTPEAQRRIIQLLDKEEGLAPWLKMNEPELVGILSQQGEAMNIALDPERAAPWTEQHPEGTFQGSLVRGIFQGIPEAIGWRDPEHAGAVSDAQLNAWFGGSVLEAITRGFRTFHENATEAAPLYEAFMNGIPVAWDLAGDVVAGILPGSRGSRTSEHMVARDRGAGLGDIIRYIPIIGGLMPVAVDLATILSTRDYMGEEMDYSDLTMMKVFGIPANEWLVVETPERSAKKQRNLDNFRAAIDRLYGNRDIVQVLDLVQGWDAMSEEAQREILGDDLADEIAERDELNQRLSGVMNTNFELLESTSIIMSTFRGGLEPDVLQKLGKQAIQAATDYWFAVKARTDVSSFAWRYTWDWSNKGPELEAQADQAIIMAMVQKGRPLQNWEIEAITNRFTEFGPELAGEVVFDWLNLIPGEVIAKFFGKGKDAVSQTIKSIAPRAHEFITTWFRTGAVRSVAWRFGNAFGDVSRLVAKRVGVDVQAFTDGLRFVVNNAADPEALSTLSSKYGIARRSARRVVEAFEAVSPEGFNAILDNAVRAVRDKGLDVTPRRISDEIAELVSKAYRNGRRLVGAPIGVGAADEGMLQWVFEGVGEGAERWPDWMRSVASGYMQFQRAFRNIWTPLVLTWRPGYTAINHMDNAFRGVVYGVDLTLNWNRIRTRTADWITDEVAAGWGRSYEFGGQPQIAAMLLDGTLKPVRGSYLLAALQWGWENTPEVGGALKRFGSRAMGAMSAVNSASEAMARVRLYDKLLNANLDLLMPAIDEVIEAMIGGQSDEIKDIVRQGMRQHGSNPARLNAYLRSEAGIYSALIPPHLYSDWDTILGPARARDFVTRTVDQIQNMVERGTLNADNIQALFKNMTDEALDSYKATQDVAARARAASEGVAQPELGLGGLDAEDEIEDLATGVIDEAAEEIPEEVPPLIQRIRDRVRGVTGAPKVGAGFTDAERAYVSGAVGRAETAKMHANAIGFMEQDLSDILASRHLFASEQALTDALTQAEVFHMEIGHQMAVSTANTSNTLSAAFRAGAFADNMDAYVGVTDFMVKADTVIRGPQRRFGQYRIPGPMLAKDMGLPVGPAWQTYWGMTTSSYIRFIDINTELTMLMETPEGIAEIGRRYAAGELLPTWQEFLGPAGVGWQPQFTDGQITGIWWEPPKPDGTPNFTTHYNTLFHQEFAQTFGFVDQKGWETLQITQTPGDIVREAAEEVAQADPQAAVQALRQQETARAVWDDMLGGEYVSDITNRTAYTAILDAENLKNPDDFFNALDDMVNAAEDAGDLARARALRRQGQSLRAELNNMLVAEGLETVQISGPIRRQWLSPGVHTELQAADRAIVTYDHMVMSLQRWQDHLLSAIDDGTWQVRNLASETRQALNSMADEVSGSIAEGIEAAQRGGTYAGLELEGAINRVNDIMIDYNTFGSFDRFMKENVAPFWMFPRYSLPMWVETMARKPWLMSLYLKYMRGSERAAYAAGLVTRSGEALPSTRGYYPVPHTDKWINPASPFSVRYAFPNFEEQYEVDTTEKPVTEIMGDFVVNWVRPFGLHMSPIMSAALYGIGALDENEVPKFAAIPQISLMPPFMQQAIKRFFISLSPEFSHEGNDMLTPFVSWKDFLVGERVLRNAVEACRAEGVTRDQCLVITENARAASDFFQRQDDPELMELWNSGKEQLETSDYLKTLIGYMTGFYFKEYTTAQAEFIALRGGTANLMAALNDEARAAVFEMPADVVARREHYLDQRYNTPEGLLLTTYRDISFVTTEEGEPAFGVDRWEIIHQLLHEEEVSQAWFEGRKAIFDEFDATMQGLPVGASSEAIQATYINLADQLAKMEANDVYKDRKTSAYVGYAPEKMVFDEFVDVIWRSFRDSLPIFDPSNETYSEYKARREQHIESLSTVAPHLIRPFYMVLMAGGKLEGPEFKEAVEDIRMLSDPSANMPQQLLNRLVEELSNPLNYEAWEKSHDTEWEALMNAWQELFWGKHWEAVVDPETGSTLGGDGFRLAQGQFLQQFPEGRPSDEQLKEWVQNEYPGRFDDEQLMVVLRGNETFSIEDRQQAGRGDAYLDEQRLWDMVWRIDPGRQYAEFMDAVDVFGKEYGISSSTLATFRDTGGNSEAFKDKEKWNNLLEVVARAVVSMNVGEPTEAEMQERMATRELNDAFVKERNQILGDDWPTLQIFYLTMDTEDRYDFREEFPDEYQRLQDGWDMQDTYAIENPLWAQYYHRDVYKAMAGGATLEEAIAELKEKVAGSGVSGGGGWGSGGARSAGGGRAPSATRPSVRMRGGLRGAQTGEELLNRQLGKGGITNSALWPAELLRTIGRVAASDMEKTAADGEPISASTQDYLKNLDANDDREIQEEVANLYKLLGIQGARQTEEWQQ